MNNRMSSRRKIREHAVLCSSRVRWMSVKIRDVSLGGMFIETGSLALPLNAAVDVRFGITGGSGNAAFHLKATVVRRDPAGVGLMFMQMETGTIRSLSTALSRYSPNH